MNLPVKGDCVRFATLNLWGHFADWPRRRALLAERLPELDVDLYFFQEVVSGGSGGDQLAELADALGHEWTARVVADVRRHEGEEEGVAILSRVPLLATAVRPLAPCHPPRQGLEATIEWNGRPIRVMTLHASVSVRDARDEQIGELAHLDASPLVIGSDLNAPPAVTRPLLRDAFVDTLGWDETATWPVDAGEFVAAWREKLGASPDGDPEPRRLDYLLVRDLRLETSGTLALANEEGSASDHHLVWADLARAA